MHCMMRISEIVADLPGAYRYVAAPSPALWTVYLVSFLAPALGWVEGARLRWWLAVSAALSLALLYTQRYTHRASSQLTALPLKGGLAIHLKIAGHPTPLLVDCGNTNAFHTLLAPFLRARGENRIHALALTHGEARHMDAAPLVLEHFKPATVAVNTARFRSSSYRHFLEQLRRDEIEPVRLEAGLEFAGWQVLHPPPALTAARADTAALVLRGRLRGTTFLLLSDLDRQGQRQLLDHAGSEALRAQIVVTGLPADGEPLMDDLLQAVRPELIVVGDDQWPVNRRASARLLARLTAGGAQVLSTSQTGAVTIRITDHAWEARPARPPSRSTPRKGLPPIRKWFDIPEQPIDPATDDTPAMRQGIAVNPSASEPEEKQNDP
jgi:beta-lactamase superfamily II metal-dependent hydrolase